LHKRGSNIFFATQRFRNVLLRTPKPRGMVPLLQIEQMRGKAGGALQFASCLNAPSLPARNDRIVTVSNLLFAA